MSTPYTPVATYHNQINVTVDGDPADSGEFNTPFQQCADNAAFCKAVIDPLISGGTISPSGALTIDADVSVNALHTAGAATFAATVTVTGDITSTGGNIASAGELSGAALLITGDSTQEGQINNTSGEIITGGITCIGAASFTDLSVGTKIAKLNNAVVYGANGTDRGRMPRRPLIGSDTGDAPTLPSGPFPQQAIQPAVHDWVIWPAGTLTENRYWKLSNTGFPTVPGDWIQFTNNDAGSNSVTIYDVDEVTPLGVVEAGHSAWFANVAGIWYFAGGT